MGFDVHANWQHADCLVVPAQALSRKSVQVCDGLTHAQRPLCEACRAEPQAAAAILAARSMRLSGAHTLLVKVQVLLIHRCP